MGNTKLSWNNKKMDEIEKSNTQKDQRKIKVNKNVICLAMICVMICLSFYFVNDAFSSGADAASEAFSATKEAVAKATYDEFYSTAFDYSEREHHVSNDVSINIGRIKEEQKLEVLKAYDISYEITDNDDEVESWLEVPAYGVFTVDLRKSEFIVDDYNQYVLVRVASPVLSQFTLDHENVRPLYFEEGVFDNAEDGYEMTEEQMKNAEKTLRISMMNNQENYLRAEKSAQTILGNMVRQLNPQLADLTVEVEFMK